MNKISQKICSKCIGAQRSKAWVKKVGELGRCEFHNSKKEVSVVPLEIVIKKINYWFLKKYNQGDIEYDIGNDKEGDQYGKTLSEILGEIKLKESIVDVLIEEFIK